jgi:hypothetical protein
MRAATRAVALFGIAALVGLFAAPVSAGEVRTYRVNITNLTDGQPLTPPVVATHSSGVVFRVGGSASFGVKEIAENGNNAPLLQTLDGRDAFFEVLQAGDEPLVPPGTPGASMGFPRSVTITIDGTEEANRLSIVSMLVCTNDGFTGVSRLALPAGVGQSTVAFSAGYDAGTEINTEDFADIVPPCQDLIGVSSGEPGTGTSDPALAEGGVIHHHTGIMGGSDLVPAIHGWDDPVARIRVTRIG